MRAQITTLTTNEPVIHRVGIFTLALSMQQLSAAAQLSPLLNCGNCYLASLDMALKSLLILRRNYRKVGQLYKYND